MKGKFSIKKTYSILMGAWDRVIWRRVLCNNKASPKSKFLVWLAVQNRIATIDRIHQRNVPCSLTCCLCNKEPKRCEHLVFFL